MMPNVNAGPGGGGEWSSEGFRGTMVKKLEEALRDFKGNVSQAAAIEAERKAFSEASTRNDYLSSISKIILAVKNRAQQQQQQQLQQQQQQQGFEDPGGNMVQRPPLSLQQQQQMQLQMQQQLQMRVRANVAPPSSVVVLKTPPNVMNSGGVVSQLQARLTQRMPNPQMGNMGHRPMMGQQVMVPQGNPRMSQMGGMSSGGGIISQQQQQANRGPPPMYMNAAPNSSNVVPSNNSTLPPGGSPMIMSHSPNSNNTGGGQPSNNPVAQQQQQQVGSSANTANQFLHSPINQGGMGTSMPSPVNNPRGLAPSPMSTSVLTPHNEPPGSVEDHQYLEKVRELGKYIEPLQRMIAKIGNEDQVKLSKMKRLMDILSNPNKRMPIETLLKCETVLKRIIVDDSNNIEQGGEAGGPGGGDLFNSASINPLLEAVHKLQKQIQPPGSAYVPLNHSLQRTLGGPLETMFGPDIPPPSYTKKRKLAQTSKDSGIPDVLQGEIARLMPHFKVNLDPTEASSGAPPLKLICQLDDQDLPPVPALNVTIPKDYPRSSSPRLFTNPRSNEYDITPFFKMVEGALKERLLRMAPRHTLTQLLNAWEMSVRASCSPKAVSSIQEATKHSVILGL